jgi:transaldolase
MTRNINKRFDKIKIFYDGTNIIKYGTLDYISGFTTNTTLMKSSNNLNYHSFYEKNEDLINNRCISMQVFRDTDSDIYNDAKLISAYGNNVYVKIPIIKSNGNSNINIIKRLLDEGIKVNITAIFTEKQLLEIYDNINVDTKVIVSIFSGRISDTCVNPCNIVEFGCKLFSNRDNIEILWAGCKDNLSLQHAINCGCDIITIPDSIIDRLSRVDTDLEKMSLETVYSFNKDGVEGNIII